MEVWDAVHEVAPFAYRVLVGGMRGLRKRGRGSGRGMGGRLTSRCSTGAAETERVDMRVGRGIAKG